MRRSIIPILVALFYVTSLGAAPGPDSSESIGTTSTANTSIRNKLNRARPYNAKAPKPYQIGTASWYGSYFQGRPTASGEPYDMHQFTAAHLKLPLGTWVRVTNLRNGNWVILRVNDRGPYVAGRILDVSYGAARMLDFKSRGLTRVRVDIVQPEVATSQTVAKLQ